MSINNSKRIQRGQVKRRTARQEKVGKNRRRKKELATTT